MESQQEQIVILAAEQFKQYGIRSVSIDDLCRQLNMSKKTFYVYFRQKEDLIIAVLDYLDCKIDSTMKQEYSGISAESAAKKFLSSLQKIKEMRNLPPFQYDLNKYYPEIKRNHDKKIFDYIYSSITRHLKNGIDEGIYRSDLDIEACATYVTLIHQQSLADIYTATSISIQRLINFYIHTLSCTILTDQSKSLINNI